MNKKDFTAIIILGFVVAVIATILLNSLFGVGKGRSAKVEIVEPISTEFSTAGKEYLTDQDKSNFSVDVNYQENVGNNKPFGP